MKDAIFVFVFTINKVFSVDLYYIYIGTCKFHIIIRKKNLIMVR